MTVENPEVQSKMVDSVIDREIKARGDEENEVIFNWTSSDEELDA